MKVIPIASAYDSGATSLADALKITTSDGAEFGFTGCDRDETIDGLLYRSAPGLLVTSIAHTAGTNVDNLELSTLDDGTVFTKADVLGGYWRNAAFELFRYDWRNPAAGRDVLMTGTLGEGELRGPVVVFELRGLQQYLQQPVGEPSTKTCRARLGDERCTVDLAPWTHSGTVSAVATNQVFTAASLVQPDDYFAEGVLTWTSGPNAGLRQKVKAYASQAFTLALPMVQTVAIGHTFSVHAGCRLRLEEDCRDKFDNVLNFQGEPHRPLVDELTKTAEPAA